jgi:hypothetical protein
MMGNYIHSVMNPVTTLEEEDVGTGFITECMWFPIISLFFFQCRNWIYY